MTTESTAASARRPTRTPRTGRPKLPPKDAAKVRAALDVLYRRLGTHAAVGEAIGVSESAVGALRGERNQASLPTCAEIARALKLADADTPDGDARARLLVLSIAQIRGL
jgi:DNA-binding XRE family transcriptional regulator